MKSSTLVLLFSGLGVMAAGPLVPRAPHANERAITLLKELEGFVPNIYEDQIGIPTVGYGHNCKALGCDGLKLPLTEASATELMKKDLAQFEQCVCSMPNAAKMNTNQYSALVSYAFNSGCEGTKQAFGAHMQRSDFSGICNALPTTNTINGILTTRRTKEKQLCVAPTTIKSGC